MRLHDEHRRPGACREFTRILPPVRTERPIVLRGFAPGDEMRSALVAGTRRSLDLGEAVLKVRDDRGAPFTDLPLWATVSAWCPSAHGADLIDLELEGTPGRQLRPHRPGNPPLAERRDRPRAPVPRPDAGGEPYDLFAETLDVLADGN
ncbi:hypothetical protein [Streptomyces flavotricini]|uniref:hypothetical protein n=1 Tax=Streptomyces flavotricini TaxID=66888 RepID=UPI0027E21828|nr:hypothetical protein [Streptomyces flavotricini]